MSSSRSQPKKRKKYPPSWRKPEDVELSEEIRDLQRDIATHSTSAASEAPSCAKDGRTRAHDKQPGTQEPSEPERDHPTACAKDGRTRAHNKQPGAQEPSEPEREHPTASRTRKRRSTSTKNHAPRRKLDVPDLSTELHDLKHDAMLH